MGRSVDKQNYVVWFLALVAATLLFVGGPDNYTLRSFRYLWGGGHLFCFALWAYLYVRFRAKQSFFRQVGEVLVLTFILGGITELIQAQIGREAAWQDLGNDLIGGLLGVVFFAESRKTLSIWQLRFLQVPVLLLFFWTLLPTAKVMIDDSVAFRQFPLLSGFETPLEISRWSGSVKRSRDHQVAFSGNSSLRIALTTQRYSGIGLKDFPRDWSAYGAVRLRVFNPDQNLLTLHFRIHDQYHTSHKNSHSLGYSDRFNTSFKLKPGWNRLQVALAKVAHAPKGRLLDLTKIGGMGLFVGKLAEPRTIYIDDVMLIP